MQRSTLAVVENNTTGQLQNFVDSTKRFYAQRSEEYFNRTVKADLTHLYDRFLALLPPRARILDAGCGSGRDLKNFKLKGFRPFGVDASDALVRLAHEYSGVECQAERLEDIAYDQDFDGVWACASLLHIPKSVLPNVLKRLHHSLAPGGVLFATVQIGSGESLVPDGRFYAYYEPEEFLQRIRASGFAVEESWLSEDSLPGRPSVRWVNVLGRAL